MTNIGNASENSEDVLLLNKLENGITIVTLNQPRSINALSDRMLETLNDSWKHIAEDRSTKVVILRSAGPNFCAGHNLKEMTARRSDEDGGFAYFNELFALCAKMMVSIVHLPQPVIAEVKGIATAAGCQLVASCDLAIASDTARFATSGVNIGLFCSTPMVALSRNISRKHAMEMLLLGEFISSQRAEQIGLVNKVVSETELDSSTMAMAETIAGKSPIAVKIGKEAFYKQAEMELEAAYEYAGKVMAENMMTRDATAGIGAFANKKEMPEWSGE